MALTLLIIMVQMDTFHMGFDTYMHWVSWVSSSVVVVSNLCLWNGKGLAICN